MRKSDVIYRITAFIMCAMLCILAFPAPAKAANTNSCTYISGSLSTVRFQVETGKRWIFSDYIKFTQQKGTAVFGNSVGFSYKEKTYKEYGIYSITAKPIKGEGSKSVSATWQDGSYILRLSKNTTYEVTVSRNSTLETLKLRHFPYIFDKWQTNPTWQISVTKGIIACN